MPATTTPLLNSLEKRALEVYCELKPSDDAEVLRHIGAMIVCVGLGGNGGFVGGVVENSAREDDPMINHMVDAFRFFGLNEHAELMLRGEREYARFRPNGDDDLNEADEAVWDELDETFYAVVTEESIEAALQKHTHLLPLKHTPLQTVQHTVKRLLTQNKAL